MSDASRHPQILLYDQFCIYVWHRKGDDGRAASSTNQAVCVHGKTVGHEGLHDKPYLSRPKHFRTEPNEKSRAF